MPVTRRRRTVAAAPAEVWRTVSDPHQMPRWWPRVERVEGVDGRGFTQVLRSDRGVVVRADFRFGTRHKPTTISWSQELRGTPFERLLRSSETTVALQDAGAGATAVELRIEQRLNGMSRLGGFLVRRAARRQLDGALDGLVALYGAAAAARLTNGS
jgi:uncharacterized protein YndB with AHSA1/START domain